MVDDEKDVLDLFDDYLKSSGYNTISFDNPLNALEYFYKNINNCSMVITDYKMSQMSGIDFIKKIREKENTDRKIKTIIISAFIKDSLPYDKSYVKLVDRILEKPVYLDRLKKEVEELTSINIHQKPDRNKN